MRYNKESTAIETLSRLLGWIVLLPVVMWVSSNTTQHLWNWFIANPTGFRELTQLQALGLSGAVGFLVPNKGVEMSKTYKEKLAEWVIARGIIYPIAALLIGYIIHSFM